MMDRSKTKSLLDKYLAGTCSPEEKMRVESWLERAGEKKHEWSGMAPEARKRYRSALYKDIGRTAGWQQKTPVYLLIRRIAAAILLLIGFSFLLYRFGDVFLNPTGKSGEAAGHFSSEKPGGLPSSVYVSHHVPAGETKKINLDDGTVIWLNAASSIRYPEQFEGSKREVFMEGEAFFQVAPDKDKPFIIHTGDIQTQVLGTSFNVRAYKGEKEVQVVVASGKVEVSLPDGKRKGQKKLLLPNQMATYVKSAESITAKAIKDAGTYAAWTEGMLTFDHSSMKEVIATLERALGLNIDIETPEVYTCEITGSFPRDQEINMTIEAICKSIDAKYTILDGHVTIKGPGCQ